MTAADDHGRRNRRAWNRMADQYQEILAELGTPDELTWGWWRHSEHRLDILGELTGRDVLDLGCGAAGWARRLADHGANVVGIDASARQLAHARDSTAGGAAVALVNGDAERLPFADASFDVAVSNWGALSFCDPHVAVPEAARVLRPGGLLVVCTSSPIYWLCTASDADQPGTEIRRSYFDLHRSPGNTGTVRFQLPYGGWIRTFAEAGLTIEALIEPVPDPATVIPAHLEQATWRHWLANWPFDVIWKVRKPTHR
ncbi:class I SAM-dependent methyltransferase [Verrucosispora sioxanthis]|uniref:Class I SAM-dependent methyltransferase n=1 Tax=Verrucosispora sioxanthis TaxID=2499994 RepID=A0A6M1KU72_9ACTN|nr:class I SAM-dependent methyltransferase [Verrucosispora sioxanthis]NEE64438.1 class I SAM-dependent methyltransferase [Verrucosispora sioxanthis]NGM13548.1 class I SAM-dependent methyltransferase [Verrucosispora sioxanthis]